MKLNKSLRKIILRWMNVTMEELRTEYPEYAPKLFGEQQGVSYEIEGIGHSFCSVTKWANGEGYDIFFDTEENEKLHTWDRKHISLHDDELECMFACLNHLHHFDE